MSLQIKNFQFSSSQVSLDIHDSLTIKVHKHQMQSAIYHQPRYFILSIIPCKNQSPIYEEEIETPPIYENETYSHKFDEAGAYLIQCANSVPIKAMVTVTDTAQSNLVNIQKEQSIQDNTKVNQGAQTNKKQKVFGGLWGSFMDHINYMSYLKENEYQKQEVIDKSIQQNNENSQYDTVSTFNTSFQQQQIRADTLSETVEPRDLQQQFLDRKRSDPLVSSNRNMDIQNQPHKEMDWQEKIVNWIQGMQLQEIKQDELNKLLQAQNLSTQVLKYLEQEFLLNITQ